MIMKRISTACIAASLVIVPVGDAAANDGLVGGIVGGIIGGAIVNHANRQPQRVQRVQRAAPPRATVSSATREANRQTQVALNYFGFPAGTPDGVIGRNSRAAIANYQAFMGYPPSGQLNQFERDFLVTSYNRASIGGPHIAQMVATNPQGVRGLLHTFRDEMMGTTVAAQPMQPATPQTPLAVVAPAPTAAPVEVVAPAPEPAPSTGLPNFMSAPESQASLASHCNRVSLLTNSNGGFTTLASMTDPGFALEEQFCLARTYAIAQGEELAAKVQGFTRQQIVQQCDAFGPAMKDHVASLSLKPQAQVMDGVGAFILQSGMAPAQLAGTAKICLSVGYRTDDMDVAVGSALLLAVLGERVYAELMGHHLAQGFGASKRPDLALDWYDMGLDAISTGSTAVFVPGHADRGDLIRAAAYAVGGRAMPAVPDVQQSPTPAGLPVFDLGGAAKDVKN
jgi:peptidoglycan hydrolase-like protein with peptidoglycan-binding domain